MRRTLPSVGRLPVVPVSTVVLPIRGPILERGAVMVVVGVLIGRLFGAATMVRILDLVVRLHPSCAVAGDVVVCVGTDQSPIRTAQALRVLSVRLEPTDGAAP